MTNPVEILLVEDSMPDANLVKDSFSTSKVPNNLTIIADGEKAVQYLKQEGEFESSNTPQLVILDLNIPKLGGKEILEFLKNERQLKHIPVIVLSTSESEQDIMDCYRLNASAYLAKPVELDDFMEIIRFIDFFWLNKAKLPKVAGVYYFQNE